MRSTGITAADRSRGALAAPALREAVTALREEGYVVLNEAVPLAPVQRLRDAFARDLDALAASGALRARRIRRAPPSEPPLVHPAIIANPFAAQLSRAVLGPRVYNNLYSADVNLPGSSEQRLHVDAGQLWPNLPSAHPAASLMVSVPLVETSDENGSTELWPGTHLDTRFGIFVPPEAAEERRRVQPPLRANMQAGSLIVRDARLWHRGMPNVTEHARVVVTMMHHIFWLERGAPLELPRAAASALENRDLVSHVQYSN